MQAFAVVKANALVSHFADFFTVLGVVFLPNSFHLKVQKESLHGGVVPAIASAAHANRQAIPGQQCLILSAGVLGELNRLSRHLNYGGVV